MTLKVGQNFSYAEWKFPWKKNEIFGIYWNFYVISIKIYISYLENCRKFENVLRFYWAMKVSKFFQNFKIDKNETKVLFINQISKFGGKVRSFLSTVN